MNLDVREEVCLHGNSWPWWWKLGGKLLYRAESRSSYRLLGPWKLDKEDVAFLTWISKLVQQRHNS